MNQELSVIPAEQSGPMVIIQAAIASGTAMDAAQIERLMEMQFKWNADLARKAYAAAMIGLKGENLSIQHDKQVSYTGTSYTHASISRVCEILTTAAAKHGFSHAWKTDQTGGMIGVTCILTHRDGHFETVRMESPPDSSGKKNPIQQLASTVTYLERYTLLAICGASTTVDDDGRGAGDPDTSKAEPFIERAINAQSYDELQVIWREAMAKIDAKNDVAAFNALHEACATRKAEIKASSQKVPA